MSAWDLLKKEDYLGAVAGFTDQIKSLPSVPAFNNRGMAYLHLGEYELALADFRSANAKSSSDLNTVCNGDMCGVALWLSDRKNEALATWQLGVEQSLAGNVRYGDAAGGLTIGNLLYFAGIQLGKSFAVDAAMHFLRKRLKTKQSLAWPGSVSRYLLGHYTEQEMFDSVSNTPILRDRQLCQVHFYIGAQALKCGDRQGYIQSMSKAYSLGNTAKIGAEYYLALHEKTFMA